MTDSTQIPRVQCGWIPGEYAIVRLESSEPLPDWARRCRHRSGIWSMTERRDESSLCCLASAVPPNAESIGPYRALEVELVGTHEPPLPSTMIGVLAGLTQRIAELEIPVLAISTFETDILLVPSDVAWRVGVTLGMDRRS